MYYALQRKYPAASTFSCQRCHTAQCLSMIAESAALVICCVGTTTSRQVNCPDGTVPISLDLQRAVRVGLYSSAHHKRSCLTNCPQITAIPRLVELAKLTRWAWPVTTGELYRIAVVRATRSVDWRCTTAAGAASVYYHSLSLPPRPYNCFCFSQHTL